MEQNSIQEQQLVLDFLFSHNLFRVREFLEQQSQPFSGTKAELRNRIEELLAQGTIALSALFDAVHDIEGWGNQHLYFYRAPAQLTHSWRIRAQVENILRQNGKNHLLNNRRTLLLPSNPELSRIAWTEERIRFEWLVMRNWEEPVPDQNINDESNGIIFKAFRKRIARGLLAFDWDLITGESMLMIQHLPSGSSYEKVRDQLIAQLSPIIDLSVFSSVRVNRAIAPLIRQEKIRKREFTMRTGQGSQVNIKSSDRKNDAFNDPIINFVRVALGTDAVGSLGNFYWITDTETPLTKELHMKIYAKDQRVGIFGEHNEEEIRYVVRKIRESC